MSHPARAAMTEIAAALASISIANGYSFDVASVRQGRPALVTAPEDALPVLSLFSIREEPTEPDLKRMNAIQVWRRIVVLQAHALATEAWDTDLDALLDDIKRALFVVQSLKDFAFIDVAYTPPDAGGSTCMLQCNIQFTYRHDVRL